MKPARRAAPVRSQGVVQLLRRAAQASVACIMVSVVFLGLYAHYRAADAIDDLDAEAGWRAPVLAAIHEIVDPMDDPWSFLQGFGGNVWSMRLFGYDITDPLAALDASAASLSIHAPLLMSILLPVLLTLLLGKVYCSWLCPANVIFELASGLRRLLRFLELRPANLRFSRRNKYLLLLAGLVMGALGSLPLFALFYPPAVLSRTVHALIFGTAATGTLVFFSVLLAFELLVSPRWWCRYMCPGGALYGLMGWPRLLRVRHAPDLCTNCGACHAHCKAGLDPPRQSFGIECDNCGQCVRHCGSRAMSWGLGLPAWLSRTTIVLLLLAPLAPRAGAHHILGLPHYSYKENYPQVPVLEYPAESGPYDILLTAYPGVPNPGEAANLSVYVKDKLTGQVYDDPVQVRVLRTFTFGSNQVILEPVSLLPLDRVYTVAVMFPADGEYIVEVSLEVEGKLEVIPFLVVAGDPSSATAPLLILMGAMGIFIVVVRAVGIKRGRGKNPKEGDLRSGLPKGDTSRDIPSPREAK